MLAWFASLKIALVLLYTSLLNTIYLVQHGNIVQEQFPEEYGADKEWLFGAANSGAINFSVVHDFIHSDQEESNDQILHTFLAKPTRALLASDRCVARLGEDSGSLYAFCDELDYQRMPSWAQSFDAITIQSAYLSTPQEFRSGSGSPYLAIFQAFRNEQQGWFKQEGIQRMYCTTRLLAHGQREYEERIVFTKAHGVLRSINCANEVERVSLACRTIQENPSIEILANGAYITSYEVFRTAKGVDLILHPFSARESLGEMLTREGVWPLDTCLYVRDGSLGWFGAGYSLYFIHIPSMALIAKIQLIAVMLIIWSIKYQFSLHRVHDALFQSTRLGLFPAIVLQMLISAYYEQDIMRSIYVWEEYSFTGWVLWIISSISASVSLLGIQLLRFFRGSAISSMGCNLAIFLSVPVAISENIIATIHYSAHTIENGLQAQPSVHCPTRYATCAVGKFNYLHLVNVFALGPVLGEMVVNRYFGFENRKGKVGDYPADATSVSMGEITKCHKAFSSVPTSFETVCLEGEQASHIIRDVRWPYITIKGRRHVLAEIVTASGFTMIEDRFLIRTKDLVWVVLATTLSSRAMRDTSVVIWPLQMDIDGVITVQSSRRVFLRGIRKYELHGIYEKSLMRGVEKPLA